VDGLGPTSGLTNSSDDRLTLMKHLHPSAIMSHLYQDLPPESHGNASSGTSAGSQTGICFIKVPSFHSNLLQTN
jgi:hypothetical protein